MNKAFHFLVYHAADEDVHVQAIVNDETVWLTQKSMSELFGVDVHAFSKYPSNIYAEGELLQEATLSKMERVQKKRSGTRQTAVLNNCMHKETEAIKASIEEKMVFL